MTETLLFYDIATRCRRAKFERGRGYVADLLDKIWANCYNIRKLMRTAVRPDKIRAFKREVWANCPAAPAAVSAAHSTTADVGRSLCYFNRCCKPEDLPHALQPAFPRGCGNAELMADSKFACTYFVRSFRAPEPPLCVEVRALFFIIKSD